MDIHPGVAALQATDLDAQRRACARRAQRHLAARGCVEAAGAADTQRSLLFPIEVEEVSRLQDAALELCGAGQAAFFVDSENKLQRTMLNVGALHDRKGRRDADAVIGAQ